jgi:hypothetical protein
LQSRKSAIIIGIGAVAAMVIIIIAVAISMLLRGTWPSGTMVDGMMSEMMMEGNRMRMPAAKDVIMILESEYELPAGKQSEVSIKVLDKQTNEPMQGAQVIIGIEKGLPMTTMDMTGGGMFNALEKGNGTYAFVFTPESKGYYTIHAHVIPSGKQMHSMMENHADLIILSQ